MRRRRHTRSVRREREARAAAVERAQVLKKESRDYRLRRWEGAETHRLNRAHWQRAYGRSINLDLLEQLETLRTRCSHAIQNDPMAEGLVNTFAQDVVGQNGPKLQVKSDNEAYNNAHEEAWEEYAERPDPTRDQSLADTLKVDIRLLFSCGEFLHQFANARREGPFEFAIRSPHPRSLESPLDRAGDPLMFMGLGLKPTGGVAAYHFRDEPPGLYVHTSPQWRAIDAQNIQHRFIAHEPDQLRGFPWLAVSLEDMADLRDLDKYVIEAAKNAAAQGILWYTDHPEAMVDLQLLDETRPIELGMQQTGPAGYKPMMVMPTQPSAQYKEFRHERLRGYGRPIGMPLMMILLSSEGNSFSGANHDGQIYIRSVEGTQVWLHTGTLTGQARQIGAEVAIAKGIRRPRKVEYEWTFTTPPHPDPKKNYEALRMQLEDGSISLLEVCAKLGRDFDSVQAARAYVVAELKKLGLPEPPVNIGSASGRKIGSGANDNQSNDGQSNDGTNDGEGQTQNDRAYATAHA